MELRSLYFGSASSFCSSSSVILFGGSILLSLLGFAISSILLFLSLSFSSYLRLCTDLSSVSDEFYMMSNISIKHKFCSRGKPMIRNGCSKVISILSYSDGDMVGS